MQRYFVFSSEYCCDPSPVNVQTSHYSRIDRMFPLFHLFPFLKKKNKKKKEHRSCSSGRADEKPSYVPKAILNCSDYHLVRPLVSVAKPWLIVASVPYILMELPMNLIMKRLGANVTLPIMVILWGVVCAC
jgi:hypothetical protein